MYGELHAEQVQTKRCQAPCQELRAQSRSVAAQYRYNDEEKVLDEQHPPIRRAQSRFRDARHRHSHEEKVLVTSELRRDLHNVAGIGHEEAVGEGDESARGEQANGRCKSVYSLALR